MQYVAFGAWLLSLSMMLLRLTHVVACMFIPLCCQIVFTVWMCYDMLTSSPFDGYLDYLRLYTIIHKAVINICSEKSYLGECSMDFWKRMWTLLSLIGAFFVNVKLIHSVVQVFYIFNNFFGLLFNVNQMSTKSLYMIVDFFCFLFHFGHIWNSVT